MLLDKWFLSKPQMYNLIDWMAAYILMKLTGTCMWNV